MTTTEPTTIYQKLLAAGCTVEGHESDGLGWGALVRANRFPAVARA